MNRTRMTVTSRLGGPARRSSVWNRSAVRSFFGSDAAGGCLVGALILWVVLTVSRVGGDGSDYILIFLAAGACYVGGRLVAGLRSWLVPAALVGVGIVVMLLGPPAEVFDKAPR